MESTRKPFTPNSHIFLVNQVDGLCPLCDVALMYQKKGSKYKNYELAHIYPLNPTEEEIKLLEGEERLSDDVNSLDNIIPLCPSCHGKFDRPRTVDEYREMVSLKKTLLEQEKNRELWSQFSLEEEIYSVLESISKRDLWEGEAALSYSPTKIDEKTNETLENVTRNKIKRQVEDYFTFVKKRLAELDAENANISTVILSGIRHFYIKRKSLGESQQDIYDNIVDWVVAKSGSESRDACDIFVSFCVQNCEVFENDNT